MDDGPQDRDAKPERSIGVRRASRPARTDAQTIAFARVGQIAETEGDGQGPQKGHWCGQEDSNLHWFPN